VSIIHDFTAADLATQLDSGNKQPRKPYRQNKGLCKQEVPSALWCYKNGGIFLLQEFKASRLGVSLIFKNINIPQA